ncbi:hypothetical protein C8J57DRAFT_1384855 [Mycena rebaudengoi]|nr:hypothetical protein C8J57DRAFT_1384855 [Mycena rebaudengoi]
MQFTIASLQFFVIASITSLQFAAGTPIGKTTDKAATGINYGIIDAPPLQWLQQMPPVLPPVVVPPIAPIGPILIGPGKRMDKAEDSGEFL